MVASSSSLIANLMVEGLFAESLLYGVFFLSFLITTFFSFPRSRRHPCSASARFLYLFILVSSFLVATTHLAITFLCMSDHLVGDLPSVDFLAGQTILYVTSVALAIVLLLCRVSITYKSHGLFVLPILIILVLASIAAGYRAAYLVHVDSLSVSLALEPTVITDLPNASPLLADYKNWIVGFTIVALVSTVMMNVLLSIKAISLRKLNKMTAGRLLISLLVDTGMLVSVLLTATLPTHLLASTGLTFVLMNSATPAVGFAITALIYSSVRRMAFDAPERAEDEEPLTMASKSRASPPLSRTSSTSSFESPVGLNESEKRAASAMRLGTDEGLRAPLQDALAGVPPLAVVQARQMRDAHEATAGQIGVRPSPAAAFRGARRPTERHQRGGSRLRECVSADEAEAEVRPDGVAVDMQRSELPYLGVKV